MYVDCTVGMCLGVKKIQGQVGITNLCYVVARIMIYYNFISIATYCLDQQQNIVLSSLYGHLSLTLVRANKCMD